MSTETPTRISYREGMALLKKEEDRQREAWFVWKAESQERGEWPPTDKALEKHKAEVGTEVRLGKPQVPPRLSPLLAVPSRIPFLAARPAMTTPITLLTTRARRSLISTSLKVRREARSPAPVGLKWTPRNGQTSTSTSNVWIRRFRIDEHQRG